VLAALGLLAPSSAHAPLGLEELRALYGDFPVPLDKYPLLSLVGPAETLREAAAATGTGIFVGAALNAGHLASDTQYVSVGNAQYNLATAENSCKFEFTEPANGSFSFTGCDSVWHDMVCRNLK